MAATAQLAPLGRRAMHQVGEIGKGAHERDRKPVANRYAQTSLIFHVVGQMRQRIALGLATLVRYGFIAAGERNRLETQEWNLLGIVESKAHYSANLLVVDA